MKKATNILSALILLIGGVITAIFAIPLLNLPNSYDVVIVRSGSMEPTIMTGAVAFFKPESEYNKDDILAFHVESDLDTKYAVIHRAIEKKTNEEGKTVFVTKGDANEDKDAIETPQENVLGKVFFNIPVIGYVVSWMQSTTGKVVLIVVPVVLILYSFGQDIMNKRKSKKSKTESDSDQPKEATT